MACHCACDGGASDPTKISVCELCVDCVYSVYRFKQLKEIFVCPLHFDTVMYVCSKIL